MAKQNKAKSDLGELIRRSDNARASLSHAGAGLKEKLNFTGKAKSTLKEQPAKAIGGSLVAGFILKKILFRKKKPSTKSKSGKVSQLKKERGILITLLALLGAAAKPAVKMYATKLFKDYLKRRFMAGSQGRSHAATSRQY